MREHEFEVIDPPIIMNEVRWADSIPVENVRTYDRECRRCGTILERDCNIPASWDCDLMLVASIMYG